MHLLSEKLDLYFWLILLFLNWWAMRNQCLDATLDRWHFHLVSIVCLNMQLEYVRRILLLLNHPQKELHVTVVKFAVKATSSSTPPSSAVSIFRKLREKRRLRRPL